MPIVSFGFLGRAAAGVIYDEAINGDAPQNFPGFNLGVMGIGTSTVLGALPGNFDADAFTFTVAAGTQVNDLILASFAGPGGAIDFTPGKGFPGAPGIGAGNVGSDLLDILQVVNPLGPGTYSFQMRTGTNVNPACAVDIITTRVQTVPEPSTRARQHARYTLCVTRAPRAPAPA